MRALLFIVLLFTSFSLAAQQIFNSEKYGFSIEEPQGWFKVTDQRLDYNLKSTHGYHVISFSKYDPKTYKGLNPIISIKTGVNWRSFDVLNKDFMRDRLLKNQFLEECSLAKNPEVISLQNLQAIYWVDHYILRGVKRARLNIRRKSYIVPSGKYVFHIDFIDGQDNEDQTKLFEKLIESIKFGPN